MAGYTAQIFAAGNSGLASLNSIESTLGGLFSIINGFLGGGSSYNSAQSDIDYAQAFISSYMTANAGKITDAAGASSAVSVIQATASRGCSRATSVRQRAAAVIGADGDAARSQGDAHTRVGRRSVRQPLRLNGLNSVPRPRPRSAASTVFTCVPSCQVCKLCKRTFWMHSESDMRDAT